jgi:hypothetical protein
MTRYQCAIPAFDGLLPEPHNASLLRLLFTCAHWHGLAKLRMQTSDTLNIFDDATRCIGADFRAFKAKTCAAFDTYELDRERDARIRGHLKRGKAGKKSTEPATAAPSTRLRKTLNLQTYKHHALGDYPAMIRHFGTSDSISTEPVSIFRVACFRTDMVLYRASLSIKYQKLGTNGRTVRCL